jgi:ribonuclease HI
MELRGVARALVEADALLRSRKELDGSSVTVRSDSDYIVNAFNKRWLDKWRINGWKTVTGKYVANYPEWISLLQIVKSLRSTGCGVAFEHVAGHSGEPLNERADELAVQGRSVAATKRLNGEM